MFQIFLENVFFLSLVKYETLMTVMLTNVDSIKKLNYFKTIFILQFKSKILPLSIVILLY